MTADRYIENSSPERRRSAAGAWKPAESGGAAQNHRGQLERKRRRRQSGWPRQKRTGSSGGTRPGRSRQAIPTPVARIPVYRRPSSFVCSS